MGTGGGFFLTCVVRGVEVEPGSFKSVADVCLSVVETLLEIGGRGFELGIANPFESPDWFGLRPT